MALATTFQKEEEPTKAEIQTLCPVKLGKILVGKTMDMLVDYHAPLHLYTGEYKDKTSGTSQEQKKQVKGEMLAALVGSRVKCATNKIYLDRCRGRLGQHFKDNKSALMAIKDIEKQTAKVRGVLDQMKQNVDCGKYEMLDTSFIDLGVVHCAMGFEEQMPNPRKVNPFKIEEGFTASQGMPGCEMM
ncbi:unnamed protein product [Amoebophrya sp. A25]|nr:unnamed protein product [Amoebophrya sp. A25]|eukprot:GSA25T00017803001.1